MCDSSKMGSFDLVKNSFAAEPGEDGNKVRSRQASQTAVCVQAPTGYEAGEVWLDGFELVDVILSLLVRDLPGIVVGAGLSLDLVGRCCGRRRSYRCAFLQVA